VPAASNCHIVFLYVTDEAARLSLRPFSRWGGGIVRLAHAELPRRCLRQGIISIKALGKWRHLLV
jgi:hypothetical protein